MTLPSWYTQLQVEPVQDVPGVKEIVPLDADSHLPTWKKNPSSWINGLLNQLL